MQFTWSSGSGDVVITPHQEFFLIFFRQKIMIFWRKKNHDFFLLNCVKTLIGCRLGPVVNLLQSLVTRTSDSTIHRLEWFRYHYRTSPDDFELSWVQRWFVMSWVWVQREVIITSLRSKSVTHNWFELTIIVNGVCGVSVSTDGSQSSEMGFPVTQDREEVQCWRDIVEHDPPWLREAG